MATSPTITDRLARAYREARVLVLGDRTPKADRAFALHREFLGIQDAAADARAGDTSDWEAALLDRTRRAIIVALRRQAVTIRERWSENRGSLDFELSSPQVVLEHALRLSAAAMQLHRDDDPDASRTAQVLEFVRRSTAQLVAAEGLPPPVSDSPSVAETLTSVEASDCRGTVRGTRHTWSRGHARGA